jgi:hypothetical protein
LIGKETAMTRAVLLLCAMSLVGCGWWGNPANPGNPGYRSYAGEPGSIVDLSGPLRPVRPEPSVPIPAASALPPVSSTPLPPPRP